MTSVSLRSFDPFKAILPMDLLSTYSEWIQFIILAVLFIAITGLSLPKRLKEGRYGKSLIISVGLILTFGVYNTKKLFNFSFESFAFLGIWMVIIIFGLVFYGMIKNFGVRFDIAFAITYCIVFLSFLAITPSFFDAVVSFFPILNLLLIILFLYLIWILVLKIFSQVNNPLTAAKSLEKAHFTTPEEVEINKESKDCKKEQRLIKDNTIKITQKEIKNLNDIKDILNQMISLIKAKGHFINQEEINQLTQALRQIYQNEGLLNKGMETIKNHIKAYKVLHKKDISELEKRLSQTNNQKKKKLITEEIQYQKQMIQALNFMDNYGLKLQEFTTSFNRLIYTAIQKLKNTLINESLSYIEHAYNNLRQMEFIFKKQNELEKYLVKSNKKTIKDLKKEKKSR